MTPRHFSEQDKDILHFVINMTTDCKLDEEEIADLIELIRNPQPAIQAHKELV